MIGDFTATLPDDLAEETAAGKPCQIDDAVGVNAMAVVVLDRVQIFRAWSLIG